MPCITIRCSVLVGSTMAMSITPKKRELVFNFSIPFADAAPGRDFSGLRQHLMVLG
jgi:hypothetical protein